MNKLTAIIVMLLICLATQLIVYYENWHRKECLLKIDFVNDQEHG